MFAGSLPILGEGWAGAKTQLMKKHICLLLIIIGTACKAQDKRTFSETVSKSYKVNPGTTLALYNLEGNVTIEGYDGNEVKIDIKKTISAKTESILKEGKRDFKLNFDQKPDSLTVYVAAPWDTRPNQNYKKEDWKNRKPVEYNVELNFTVKVPKSLNVRASTVNGDEMIVRNVAGQLHVNNVNGGIEIVDAQATTKAHTVNGNITVNYLKNPTAASSYHTINGKIDVTYKSDLLADLSFKSMNGEYFTDFENYEILQSEVEPNKSKSGGGTKFKISSKSPIRIGNGGTKLKFETLNGNIYIRRG